MKKTDKIFQQLKANPIAVEPLGLGAIPNLPKTFTFPKFQMGDCVNAVDYDKIGLVTYLEWIKDSWVYTVKVLGNEGEIEYQEHSLVKGSKADAVKIHRKFVMILKYAKNDYVAYEDLSKQPKEKGDDEVIPKIYKVLSKKLLSIDLELVEAYDNGIINNTGKKVQMSLPDDSLKVIGENAMKDLLEIGMFKKEFKRNLLQAMNVAEEPKRIPRNDKLKIGFTTQYYTLWEVTDNYHLFRQNLSKDKNEAIAKAKELGATDLTVHKDLKGMETFYYEDTKPKGDDWQFPYGKLKGEDIRHSEDVWQLERIAKQGNQYAIDRLVKLGNHTIHKGKLVTITYAKNEIAAQKDKSEDSIRIEEALKNGFVEFEVTKNIAMDYLDFNGDYDFDDSYDTILFSEKYGNIVLKKTSVKMRTYNRNDYYLPIINGKAVTIKSKTIRLTIIGRDDYGRLIGTDLKILK